MNKCEAIKIIRERLDEEKTRLQGKPWPTDLYTKGFIQGLHTALFFLGEKQAVREHEELLASILAEGGAE